MELDHAAGLLRSGHAPAILHHMARWHSTDGYGRRGLGAVLSTFYLYQKGQQLVANSRVFPYVTFALAFLCWAIFFLPEQVARVCPLLVHSHLVSVYPPALIADPAGQWPRLFLAALPHTAHTTVFYNLMSLLYRGHAMENRFGNTYVFVLFLALQLVSSLLHVWIAWYCVWEFDVQAFGLSALLMALKVALNNDPDRPDVVEMFGFTFNGRWTPWLELILLYIFYPGMSLVAHVSGLLTGMLFVFLVNPFQVHLGDSRAGRMLSTLQAGLKGLRPKLYVQQDQQPQQGPEQEQMHPEEPQRQPPQQPMGPKHPSFSLNSHMRPAVHGVNSRGAVTTLLHKLETECQLPHSEVLAVLSLVQRVLQQVASAPAEAKFRRVHTGKLEAKLGAPAAQAAAAFLETMGFAPIPAGEEEERGADQPQAVILCLAEPDPSWLFAHSDALAALDCRLAGLRSAQARAGVESATYSREMADMFSRGFRDRRLNFAALKATAGDVETAIRKLPMLTYRPGKPPGRKM